MTKNWTQLEKGDIKCNYICEFIPSTCYSAACKVQWTQGYTRHQDRVFYLRERRESHANSSKPERSFCACRITIKHRIVLYLSVDRISVLQRQERLAPPRRVVFFVTSLWKLSYFKVRLNQAVKVSNILFPRLATIACAILVLLFLSTKKWIFLRIWYFPPQCSMAFFTVTFLTYSLARNRIWRNWWTENPFFFPLTALKCVSASKVRSNKVLYKLSGTHGKRIWRTRHHWLNRDFQQRERCKIDNQLWFCLRKKPRINSVRVNCVYDLFELFEASKYSKNVPSVAQR